ncbi:MAG: sporulation protein YqfD [Oscillospiraceae bacterium]|nr:sporulation protein YqfD [Oscillospiraceae bacterium]
MKNTHSSLRGELRIRLQGGGTDRLLNACAEAGLPLRDISFHDGAALSASLPEDELPRMEKIAALCQCELEVMARRGGCGVRQIRRRARLAVFAAVCALLLTLSGLFVWDIEVVGNERLSKAEILRALSDCGVSEGCFWPAADAERVRSEMLLRCEDLAWMTLNVRGSRATVLVLEREEKPEIYNESAAADLVASRSGVVRELNVKNGRALVARGVPVTEGQTLVSGTMDGAAGEPRHVRADGSVRAETWPERTIFLTSGAQRKERKNGFRLILGLRFGKNRFDLVTNSRKELDECDKIMKEYTLGVEGLFRFPLGLCVEVYRPYLPTGAAEADLPGAEARALAALEEEIDGEIVSYEFDEGGDRIVLRAHCLENIAVTKETENS